MMCRESRAFLPADYPADVVSGKENISFGLMQLLIGGL
jgi:hypothetical protein